VLEKNTNRSKENMNREQRKVGDFMKKVPATINEQVKSGDICEGSIDACKTVKQMEVRTTLRTEHDVFAIGEQKKLAATRQQTRSRNLEIHCE